MKLFVWDFHGVLEKGNDDAVVEITNRVLQDFDYSKRMTKQEGEQLSGKRWHEYFAFLLPGLDQSVYLQLQSACFDISLKHPDVIAKHIQLNDHAEFVLQNIAESSFTQILISNTHPHALDLFIKMVGIENYFPASHRFGIDSHHQQHITKKDCLIHFLKDKNFPEGVVSIGDSPGDMALIQHHSKSVGYLYAHPGRVHRETTCHYKIQDLREVLKEIKTSHNDSLP